MTLKADSVPCWAFSVEWVAQESHRELLWVCYCSRRAARGYEDEKSLLEAPLMNSHSDTTPQVLKREQKKKVSIVILLFSCLLFFSSASCWYLLVLWKIVVAKWAHYRQASEREEQCFETRSLYSAERSRSRRSRRSLRVLRRQREPPERRYSADQDDSYGKRESIGNVFLLFAFFSGFSSIAWNYSSPFFLLPPPVVVPLFSVIFQLLFCFFDNSHPRLLFFFFFLSSSSFVFLLTDRDWVA